MKLFILCLILSVAALSQVEGAPALCGCPPGPLVCGSNHVTYSGECAMRCDDNHLPHGSVTKLYDGPCVVN